MQLVLSSKPHLRRKARVSNFKLIISNEGREVRPFVLSLFPMSAKSAVKAIDYPSPDTLLQLDQYIVDALDFTGFPEKYGFKKLDQIFPNDPKYGKEDPLPHYLTADRRVRDWRKISRSNQLHVIDNPPCCATVRQHSSNRYLSRTAIG